MRRNLQYLLGLLILQVWVLWACQSHDMPTAEPVTPGTPATPGVGDEVEVQANVATRAAGPSDGYVNDLIAMVFWCDDDPLINPNDPASYTFAYYSNVTAGAVTDDVTGNRQVWFRIKKKEGKLQRIIFLANIYACNIYPHMFTDAEIEAGIGVQAALNEYTHLPKNVIVAGDTLPGWNTTAGGQAEPFPMCGETKHYYSFDEVEAGKIFVLNEGEGKADEKVFLYRMAAKIDIHLTAKVVRDLGDIKYMELTHSSGNGYVGYNVLDGHINSGITVTDLSQYLSGTGGDWKTLNAWVPSAQTIESCYPQSYNVVRMPNAPDAPKDEDYIMKVDGPIYINEAVRYDDITNPYELKFAFMADDGNGYGVQEFSLILENYDILRNCYYILKINNVIKGSLSAVLTVADWTEVKVENPTPLPLK